MATVNYYRMFALQPTASPIDIKRRYRQLSFKYHPDHGGSAEKMMLINEAYGVLSNGLLRREYDRRYAAQQTTAANGSYNEYAAHPPYSQTDSSDFLRRREAAATYNRESHEQSAPLSFLWVWMGVFAMIVFGFLAYQLYDIVQTPANTGGDIPVSGIINSSTRSSNYRSGNYYSNYSNLN